MSENIRVVEEVTVKNTDVKCPGCGATIEYDPATLKLACPFCGLTKDLPQPESEQVIEEIDFESAKQRASLNWGTAKKLIVCANCGGKALYDEAQTSGNCPFCGSTSVMPVDGDENVMAPGGVVPFGISKEIALKNIEGFIKTRRFVPGKLKTDLKIEGLIGLYLPYWTFDSDTSSSYVAKIGFEHTDSDGDTYYTYKKYKGFHSQFIDDEIVFGTDKIKHPHISKVSDFDFSGLKPYQPEFLAGFVAERYTVGLNEAWDRARELMVKRLKRDIGNMEKRAHHGDKVDSVKISCEFKNVTFKYILAPVYLARYTYKGKVRPIAVNGQTGKVFCDVPSWVYLIPLIIIGIIVGFFILQSMASVFFAMARGLFA